MYSPTEDTKFQVIGQNGVSSTQIAGFFDHLYLLKQMINVLDFLQSL